MGATPGSAAGTGAPTRSPMWSRSDHGPLPSMLLLLTIVAGAVDAVSILALGRVFVANMTGNVVFVVFAAAGAPGFSLSASLFALAGFLLGAGIAGTLIGRCGDRAVLVRSGTALELVLAAGALAAASVAGNHLGRSDQDLVAALLAVAMGIQNAVARKLAVPDLTTTVLTMTLTGIAADLRSARRAPALARRFLAVSTMLVGAAAGAVLVLHGHVAAALAVPVALLAIVAVTATWAERRPGAWKAGPPR
ncbi:MAG TPA: YoaK family protein [Acidimicrobiales bacterium]|nr:YoaK family protein [Acidimicrobiales bacterium]